MSVQFKPIENKDLEVVSEIYNYYVLNSTATFHLERVDDKELLSTLPPIGHSKYQSFLVLDGQSVCGFCYLSQFRKKEAYDASAEITLYLHPDYTGKGIGKLVLDYMEGVAKKNGIKNLVGVITSENAGSIALFEKQGYFKVGHLKSIGEKFGKWLDVVSYQKQI
ncbi:MAG: N-acetyltransferase [Vicingus serpentipes]|nr:N-acetyltransferase [Vicingus serpentipes]